MYNLDVFFFYFGQRKILMLPRVYLISCHLQPYIIFQACYNISALFMWRTIPISSCLEIVQEVSFKK